jgi:hypothetical protein
VLDPLLDQPVALAMQPPGVFLLDARNPHHAAGIGLPAQIAAQRPQHPLDVNPIGLGPPRPPIHQKACRIENMIVHTGSREQAVQPEPVIAGLVARDHFDRPAQLPANLPANPFDQLEQTFPIPARQSVLARLVAQRGLHAHDPTRLAQFNCNQATGGAIIACGRRGVYQADFHRSLLCG